MAFEKDPIILQEYSSDFDDIRKKMVMTSYYKYGPARVNFGSGLVDALASAEECISAFKKDGNTEHLADAANYLMFRFKFPYPGEYYKPTSSEECVPPVGEPINQSKNIY